MSSMHERFLIYNASAGSGKTFQLVRNYLKRCLSTKDAKRFMHILAITFTKKAAGEMKVRLIKQLKLLKSYPDIEAGDRAYAEELAAELAIDPIELKHRASAALSGILHHYAAFNVSTIDSFTNRLIRSFSKDLNINGHFQVELDNDRILEEAVDRLLDELEEEGPFTEVLRRYIRQQLDDESAFDSRRLLINRGKELFQERAFPYLEVLKELDPENLLSIEAALRGRLNQLRGAFQKEASDFLQRCEELDLAGEDFRRGGLYSWVQAINQADFKPFNKTQVETFEEKGPEHIPSTKGKKKPALNDANILQELYERAKKIKDLEEGSFEEYWILDRVLKGIHALALLGEIEVRIDQIKEESGRMPIGDFNKIISKELREQPAPFLYERLGDRFQDFFIDEFQDTSRLQWENLLPLLNNALASEGSSTMIVGDAKQSIYRFRGGDLQLFVDLFSDKDASNKVAGQELYQRKVVPMEHNWRSRSGLVDFNNRFFETLSAELPNAEYREIYKQGKQAPAKAEGGYISLELLDNRPSPEMEDEALLIRINDLLQAGYRQRDICLLSRSNKTGRRAAKFLLEQESNLALAPEEALQILSADSLLIGASAEVQAIISFLEMSEFPKDKERRRAWLALFAERFCPLDQDPHDFRKAWSEKNLKEIGEALNSLFGSFDFDEWQAQELLEKCYQLMQLFEMPWQNDPYLQFFLDQIQEYQSHSRPVTAEFLQWWQETGSEKSLSIPEDTNAIQVMSVHKAKGLEFPVVIYLSAYGALQSGGGSTNPRAWVDLDPDSFGLSFSFIDLVKPPIPEFQPQYTAWYEEELSRIMMDNLNIYYVAFTRAEQELHIISQMPSKTGNQQSFESFLSRYFEAEEPGIYEIGSRQRPVKEEADQFGFEPQSFKALPWMEKLELISNVPRHWQHDKLADARWGTKMHQLLAQIRKPCDLDQVLKRAQNESWLDEEDLIKLKPQLNNLLNHKDLTELYHPDARVYNERSLLVPGQGKRIPDRLVSLNEQWYLADYKTGAELAAHQQQLQDYAQLLKEAGIELQKAVLIYLGEELKVVNLKL